MPNHRCFLFLVSVSLLSVEKCVCKIKSFVVTADSVLRNSLGLSRWYNSPEQNTTSKTPYFAMLRASSLINSRFGKLVFAFTYLHAGMLASRTSTPRTWNPMRANSTANPPSKHPRSARRRSLLSPGNTVSIIRRAETNGGQASMEASPMEASPHRASCGFVRVPSSRRILCPLNSTVILRSFVSESYAAG